MKFKWSVAAVALCLVVSHAPVTPAWAAARDPVIYKVGQVTRHAKKFEGRQLSMQGYLLVPGTDYILFSDEPSGAVGVHDLPVTGPGISGMKPNVKYILLGTFIKGGLVSSNGNPDHFELLAPPTEVTK